MSEVILFNIQRCSVHDGPGIRTTLFFKGCPLRCIWCANPESFSRDPEVFHRGTLCTGDGACLKACPNHAVHRDEVFGIRIDKKLCTRCGSCMDVCIPGALSVMGKVWDIDALVSQVKRDAPFYRNSGGGVTLSGGEAFEQPDAAYELLQKLSHALIHTTVETSGYTAWTNIEACLPFLDLVLYDIKHMNPVQHKVLTGVDNGIILENLARLGETKSKVWIRMPVIPGLNDDETSILSVAKIANNVRGLEQIELLPYHPYGIGKYAGIGKTYTLSDRKPPDNIKMDSLREQLSKVVKVAVI